MRHARSIILSNLKGVLYICIYCLLTDRDVNSRIVFRPLPCKVTKEQSTLYSPSVILFPRAAVSSLLSALCSPKTGKSTLPQKKKESFSILLVATKFLKLENFTRPIRAQQIYMNSARGSLSRGININILSSARAAAFSRVLLHLIFNAVYEALVNIAKLYRLIFSHRANAPLIYSFARGRYFLRNNKRNERARNFYSSEWFFLFLIRRYNVAGEILFLVAGEGGAFGKINVCPGDKGYAKNALCKRRHFHKFVWLCGCASVFILRKYVDG